MAIALRSVLIAATTRCAHDGLDRVTQTVSPKGTVNYGYDTASRRTSMTVAGQTQITYGYDNAESGVLKV